MKWRTLKIIGLVILAIICVFACCTGLCICITLPGTMFNMALIVENQSDQNLTVYIDGIMVGEVTLGDNITGEVLFDAGIYTITALNDEGEVVFAKRYTHDNLIYVGCFEEKAVIPSDTPTKGTSSVNLVIENNSDMVLTILVEGELIGDLGPGESITQSNLPHPCLPQYKDIDYHVIANDAQGQEIFGENLDLSELQIIDFKTLKAVIEPFYKEITFQNKTNIVVIVFVNFYRVGEIEPGETITENIPLYSDLVHVNVRDTQGKYVDYKTYNYVSWEFRNKKWEVIITPPFE